MPTRHASPPDAAAIADLLPNVPRAVLPRLLAGARPVSYSAGEPVLRPGQKQVPGLVTSGLLRVVIHSAEGRAATITYLGRGRIFGVPTLFHRLPVSVTAHDITTAVHFEPAEVVRLGRENAEFSWALLQAVSDNVITMPEATAKFVFKTVRQRVADHLLWSVSQKSDRQGDLVARTTQQEIAEAVGSVREVVARALSNLQSRGLIRLSTGGVLIVDKVGLAEQSM